MISLTVALITRSLLVEGFDYRSMEYDLVAHNGRIVIELPKSLWLP